MNNKHLSIEQIAALHAARDLDEAGDPKVEAHLRSCAQCQADVDAAEACLDILTGVEPLEPVRRKSRSGRISAAIMQLVIVALLIGNVGAGWTLAHDRQARRDVERDFANGYELFCYVLDNHLVSIEERLATGPITSDQMQRYLSSLNATEDLLNKLPMPQTTVLCQRQAYLWRRMATVASKLGMAPRAQSYEARAHIPESRAMELLETARD